MAIEIVDFPINSMVIFQFATLNYQRVTPIRTIIVLLLKFSSSSGCPKKLGYPSYWGTPMTTWNPQEVDSMKVDTT